jgi:hypothetical protein
MLVLPIRYIRSSSGLYTPSNDITGRPENLLSYPLDPDAVK